MPSWTTSSTVPNCSRFRISATFSRTCCSSGDRAANASAPEGSRADSAGGFSYVRLIDVLGMLEWADQGLKVDVNNPAWNKDWNAYPVNPTPR